MNLIWQICFYSVLFYVSVNIIAKIVNKARAKKAKNIIAAEQTNEPETTEQTENKEG